MSDIKLFRITPEGVVEVEGTSVALEKSLQALIEQHLDKLLGVRFLASEYGTGPKHGGRIDTLGIDENGCPVILEYKRALNENVVNQGLYYLDWLLDHRAEFELLVLKKFGQAAFTDVEWSAPRLLCIAGEFTKYDEHAVQQINRNIELIRYRKYGNGLLLFELVNATTADRETIGGGGEGSGKKGKPGYKTVSEYIEQASTELRDRYEALRAWTKALGDDVQQNVLQYYVAFKRFKNFCCVEVHPKSGTILLYVKVNPSTVQLEDGYTRDVREIGHFGTGDLEITIRTAEDLEKAKPLILRSYEAS